MWATEKEVTLAKYRLSSVGTRGHLHDVNTAVTAKFPTLGQDLGKVAGYTEAYQALRDIFINPSIAVHNLRQGAYGSKFALDFKTKADEYVNTLLKEHEKNPDAVKTIKEIKVALHEIIASYEHNPASTYARLLTLLQTRGVSTLPAVKGTTTAVAEIQQTTTLSLTTEDLASPIVQKPSV